MTPSAMITFPTARGPAEAYLTGAGARGPGLVVIQEYWGLVPHIKDVADRLAREGYVALAPDLYHGRTTVEEEEASHLLSELDWGRAVEELRGGVAELRERQGCTTVGVIGFCMGGALTGTGGTRPGRGRVRGLLRLSARSDEARSRQRSGDHLLRGGGRIFLGAERPIVRRDPAAQRHSDRGHRLPGGGARVLQRLQARGLPSQGRGRSVGQDD